MPLDDLAITMGKQGAGEWELHLDNGDTVEAALDEVDVSEERGFHAEGRNETQGVLYELTTGPQPGGPIRLRRRPIDADDWETVGTLDDAIKRG
ncbi:MAG: hypothetical protein ABEJ73_07355 [Haloplanus sp.]